MSQLEEAGGVWSQFFFESRGISCTFNYPDVEMISFKTLSILDKLSYSDLMLPFYLVSH